MINQLAQVHHGVVWLDDCTRKRMLVLCRINAECKLCLAVILVCKALKKHRRKARTCASAYRIKDHETLHRVATFRDLADTLKGIFNEFTMVAKAVGQSV